MNTKDAILVLAMSAFFGALVALVADLVGLIGG